MALLGAGAKLGKNRVEDAVLSGEEALQVIWVRIDHAGIMVGKRLVLKAQAAALIGLAPASR